MKKVLGRKQNIDNLSWLAAMEHIEEYVTRPELDALVDQTVAEIKETVGEKHAAYAWSAGKDSIVLGSICEEAGIHESMIAVTNLEYPAFEAWIKANKPNGCEIINTGQDIEWLKKHMDMLFPETSQKAAQWFHIVQHRAQAKYYKAHNLDMILLGRRKADGNFVGRGSNIYTNANEGVTRYSPLSDWPHEAILAYIHYHELDLPPIYGWHNGYLCGTHPWPARQWTSGNGWEEIAEIDPELAKKAKKELGIS